MGTFISLLRGVNVGGRTLIKMKELATIYGSLGLENVRTYIQSGNVIFQSQKEATAELIKSLEEEIKLFTVPTVTAGPFFRTIISKKGWGSMPRPATGKQSTLSSIYLPLSPINEHRIRVPETAVTPTLTFGKIHG